ncbi:MAG TPA: 2'-5' RNA ligase family protein [Gemmatimonadaceae bacterium]|nr:2'-5' RNA ligase family protein [Gemmatimonadaceae bacterium]
MRGYDDEYDDDREHPESGRPWRRAAGIFVLADIGGEAGERIAEIQRRYDPKLAASSVPHVTLIGSSGAGLIAPSTTVDELRAAVGPIAAATPPLALELGAPMRFMQTEIVVLPLSPHGPLRALHEAIKTSGLRFGPVRFAFSPHATLSFYPTLTPAARRELMAVRVREPAIVERLEFSLSNDPQPPQTILTLSLDGAA